MTTNEPQDRAEQLDDEELAGDYPPERPYGVDEYGTTPAEERVGEPLTERVTREEADRPSPDPGGAIDEQAAVEEEQRPVGDVASGDPTTRDVATEREAPVPAEEGAVRIVEEP